MTGAGTAAEDAWALLPEGKYSPTVPLVVALRANAPTLVSSRASIGVAAELALANIRGAGPSPPSRDKHNPRCFKQPSGATVCQQPHRQRRTCPQRAPSTLSVWQQ